MSVQLGRTYESLDAFYRERRGARSGESDFGVMWTAVRGIFPHWRVSVVHETGDIYAMQMTYGSAVELLGTLQANGEQTHPRTNCPQPCAYLEADRVLRGWEDHITDGLVWIKGRLAEYE